MATFFFINAPILMNDIPLSECKMFDDTFVYLKILALWVVVVYIKINYVINNIKFYKTITYFILLHKIVD